MGLIYPNPYYNNSDVAYGGSFQEGSLAHNPTVAPIDLTVHGSDFLWAIFAVMLATTLGVTMWSFAVPSGGRGFHVLAVIVLFTASIAYFSMASDLGSTPILVEHLRRKEVLYSGPESYVFRSVWYARYIDWVVTTPALLLTLLLATGLPVSEIIFTVFVDIVMIVTGLLGGLTASVYKGVSSIQPEN